MGVGLWGVGRGQRRGCGKRVVVVEQHRHRLGGAKVWDGALTSKVMWQLARKTKATKEFLMARGMMFEGQGRPSHTPPSPMQTLNATRCAWTIPRDHWKGGATCFGGFTVCFRQMISEPFSGCSAQSGEGRIEACTKARQ